MPIAGTFDSGKVDEIERVAIPLDVGRSLFGERETRIEVAAAGLDQALALVAPVREVAAGGAVRTWKELNRPLFFALGLEKTLMFVAVGLVLVVAALALVADLALVIATKRRELAMLAALGATPLDLRRALVTLGGALTTLGVSGGLVVGLGGAWILDHYRLLALPRQVYFLDYVPFRPELWDVVGVVGLTALLAGLSTGFAVRRVASRARFQVIRP